MARKKKKRRILRSIVRGFFSLLILCLLVVLAGVWWMYDSLAMAAASVDRLEDGLYVLEYSGDYGFDEFLEKGGATSDYEVAAFLTSWISDKLAPIETILQTERTGCSTITTRDSFGTVYFGRNYDWVDCQSVIIHTNPEHGFESISTSYLDFLGFSSELSPQESIVTRIQSLASIYAPMDGMNEKGLIVAVLMNGDDEVTHQNRNTVNLTTTTAVRLLLDQAASVDKALDLLQQYNMNSSSFGSQHLALADSSGRSVVVEYVGGEMLVESTDVVTNHYLTDSVKKDLGSLDSHERFNILSNSPAIQNAGDVRELLKSVVQVYDPYAYGNQAQTMWSVVYCPETLSADFYFDRNFDRSYTLKLKNGRSFLNSP